MRTMAAGQRGWGGRRERLRRSGAYGLGAGWGGRGGGWGRAGWRERGGVPTGPSPPRIFTPHPRPFTPSRHTTQTPTTTPVRRPGCLSRIPPLRYLHDRLATMVIDQFQRPAPELTNLGIDEAQVEAPHPAAKPPTPSTPVRRPSPPLAPLRPGLTPAAPPVAPGLSPRTTSREDLPSHLPPFPCQHAHAQSLFHTS